MPIQLIHFSKDLISLSIGILGKRLWYQMKLIYLHCFMFLILSIKYCVTFLNNIDFPTYKLTRWLSQNHNSFKKFESLSIKNYTRSWLHIMQVELDVFYPLWFCTIIYINPSGQKLNAFAPRVDKVRFKMLYLEK